MKIFQFYSLRSQIVLASLFLVIGLIASSVWLMIGMQTNLYIDRLESQMKSLAAFSASTMRLEFIEQNWGNIRIQMDDLLLDNSEFVYALMSSTELNNQILVSTPREFEGHYVPNLMPLSVTQNALSPSVKPRVNKSVLLRSSEFPSGIKRGTRGERFLEVAATIGGKSGETLTENLATFRIGVTFHQLDREIEQAILRSLELGAIGILIGSIGAYWLAEHLSRPILKLRKSAAMIASGDLQHRASLDRTTEIAALAQSFNEMSASLQEIFGKLQLTLDSFQRFVPEKFLHAIAPYGIENIQVGEAAEKPISILFADIRGYTSMSEKMSARETFDFLNHYLACMGEVIDSHNGFIDKYIGDAIMALFDGDSSDSALLAAIAMQQALIQFNQESVTHGFMAIEIGIGIHRGTVIMGTVGFKSRIESTVIGDAVNLASRIEGLTKNYNCPILLTDAVVKNLEYPEDFQLVLVDKAAKVKGKEVQIPIYTLAK